MIWPTVGRCAFTVVLVAIGAVTHAADVSVLNHVTGDDLELDRVAHERLGRNYQVIDFSEQERSYVRPVRIAGRPPSFQTTSDGKHISGKVLVLFVIRADGQVTDASIVRSTDERLSKIALDVLRTWKFEPGHVDGVPASLTAAEDFWF